MASLMEGWLAFYVSRNAKRPWGLKKEAIRKGSEKGRRCEQKRETKEWGKNKTKHGVISHHRAVRDNELALSARRKQVRGAAVKQTERKARSKRGGWVVKVVLAGYF